MSSSMAKTREHLSGLSRDVSTAKLARDIDDVICKCLGNNIYSAQDFREPPLSNEFVTPVAKSLALLARVDAVFILLWIRLQRGDGIDAETRTQNATRAWAAEILSIRLVRYYEHSERLAILTTEYPELSCVLADRIDAAGDNGPADNAGTGEREPPGDDDLELAALVSAPDIETFSALEIAVLSASKLFLASTLVQDVVNKIWKGDVVYWTEIGEEDDNAVKRATYYNPQEHHGFFSGYSRLRVPKYHLVIQSLNYIVLFALYVLVLATRTNHTQWPEVALSVYFFAFVLSEYDEIREAGQLSFYTADFWALFDFAIVFIYLAWLITRGLALIMHDFKSTGLPYDILALEGIFLIPRVLSIFSILPYFGTLLPCVSKLMADFVKFMAMIVLLFVGFYETFVSLAWGDMSREDVFMLMLDVFFGGADTGFDNMFKVHPVLGPPVMMLYVILTNILLGTVLISILSNTFAGIMENAHQEYLYVFSTMIVESTKSDHMVVLYPPFNLLTLLLVPLKLFPKSEALFMRSKLWILWVTHAPFVLCIRLYEKLHALHHRIHPHHSATSVASKLGRHKNHEEHRVLMRAGGGGFHGVAPAVGSLIPVGDYRHLRVSSPRIRAIVEGEDRDMDLQDSGDRMTQVEQKLARVQEMIQAIYDTLPADKKQ